MNAAASKARRDVRNIGVSRKCRREIDRAGYHHHNNGKTVSHRGTKAQRKTRRSLLTSVPLWLCVRYLTLFGWNNRGAPKSLKALLPRLPFPQVFFVLFVPRKRLVRRVRVARHGV